MKKISTWKVLGLIIITLGIYSLVWFARSRRQLNELYPEVKIRSWLWLLIPPLVFVAVIIPIYVLLIVIGLALGWPASILSAVLAVVLYGGIISLYVIESWWLWRFNGSINNIIRGRVPYVWAVGLNFAIGLYLVVFYQFYINRAVKQKKSEKTKELGPTKKFVALAAIFVLIALTYDIWSAVDSTRQLTTDQSYQQLLKS